MEYYGITTSTPAVPSTTPSVVRKPRKLTPAQAVAQASLLAIWKNLQVLNLGGGGRRGERVFAEVINVIVTRYIESMYAQQWSSEDEHGRHRDVMREIGNWVEHDVGPLVRLVLEDEEEDADVGDVVLRKEDIEGWKKMALGRLGRLRVGELFDIMVDWPDSLGGIMDLRAYISTPQTRLHLTASFTTAISNRILHPAASTTDILRVYISIIRAFSVLDPRGVLLDRVTRGIRRYLREREDTVRVIVRGLMGGNRNRMDDDDLSDLAEELVKGSRGASSGDPNAAGGPNGGDELDFDDLSWVPDPVDAGPEYRKVKGTDVIGSLMSLYESKEVFVREFQAVLAERLLEYDEDTEAWRNYEPEIQTLELLRLRFGEGPLQSCDVMLRDIQVGQRTDANVRRDQHLDSSIAKNAGGVQFHAKILSHLFWPGQMRDEGTLPYFIPPPGIVALQKKYEVGFSKLNGKRVLEWRDLLGSVQLDVQLEDRVVGVEDAKTWAVAALEAFEDEAGRVRRSVRYLREKLAMDEGLVRRALGYWREKGVLREVGGGGSSEREEWVVVERLSDLEGEAEGSGGHAGGSRKTPQQEASKEVEQEAEEAEPPLSQEKVVYAQFIMGMLTNAPGAMPVERIMMMLGMLVPGGVRCGVGEMGELLERLAREGKVEFVGGGWKVKK
ncbi:hypothetical protein DFH27DRAFT_483276 [Peziza echinospora]|nr:hypothetical protein DFH27DRAFT_483276 [Peziza echinospora]